MTRDSDAGKFQTLNATPGAGGVRIDRSKYDAMKKALLAVIPRREDGVRFSDLARLVKPRLPKGVYPPDVSIPWYTVVVKLDLEARGMIERVPGSGPQRVRRLARSR